MRDQLDKKLFQHTWLVVIAYVAISIIWILFSDQLVAYIFSPEVQTHVQSLKGIFFVLATGSFLFFLISTKNSSIKHLFSKLKVNMKVFKDTFEQAAVGIAHLSPENNWIRVNTKFCDMIGYQRTELTKLALSDIIHPEDFAKGKKKDQQLIKGSRQSYIMNKRYITKDGDTLHARITKSRVENSQGKLDYLIAIIEDVSSEKKANERLKESVKQKELLLREIHHRVKNNLAIISGLLELQAYNTDEERVKKLLRDSMMRIKSMALVHDSFYQSRKTSFVDFENYLDDFIEHARVALSEPGKNISIAVDCEPVQLNINQAIPCGLLINELVINAFIHAFEQKDEGTISIDVRKNNEYVDLVVKDSGQGLPSTFNLENPTSFGSTIIKTLLNQLDASVDIESDQNNGTEYAISFKQEDQKGASSSSPSTKIF